MAPVGSQLGNSSGQDPASPCSQASFGRLLRSRQSQGRRVRGRRKGLHPGGVSGVPLPDACSAAARGHERGSAEPLGLI